MKNKLIVLLACLMAVSGISFFSITSFAQEDIAQLKQQIEVLQKRVDELESKEQQEPVHVDPFFKRGQGAWDPFYEIERMQEEMNRMFQNSYNRGGGLGRGMFSNDMSYDHDFDIKENADGYEIRFDMKGLDKEKVDIQINEHSITVKGESSRQETEESENKYFSTQSFGSFMKTIPLPVDADTTKLKTEKEGESLVIKLPKKAS